MIKYNWTSSATLLRTLLVGLGIISVLPSLLRAQNAPPSTQDVQKTTLPRSIPSIPTPSTPNQRTSPGNQPNNQQSTSPADNQPSNQQSSSQTVNSNTQSNSAQGTEGQRGSQIYNNSTSTPGSANSNPTNIPISIPSPIQISPEPNAPQVEIIPLPTALEKKGDSLTQEKRAGADEGYVINFNNVSIIEYIRFISKISGKNFIFDDSDLQFNVTIVSDEPTSIENIMMALLQVLRIHDMSLLEQNNNILIHRNNKIPTLPHLQQPGESTTEPQMSEIVTQLFHLKNTTVETVANIVRSMVSPQARVQVVPETQYIVLTDIASNVNKIAELIRGIDNPDAALEIGQYATKNSTPEVLIELATKILKPISQQQTLLLIPNRAGNNVLVVSTPYLVQKAMAVLRILDSNGGSTRVYSLDKINLDELDQELNDEQRAQEEEYNRLQKEALERQAAQRRAAGGTGARQGAGASAGAGAGTGAGAGGQGGRQPSTGSITTGFQGRESQPGYGGTAGSQGARLTQTAFGVMKLQYRKGDQLQKAIQALASRLLQSGDVNQEIISAINSLQWISDSNLIVFTGTREAVQRVRELVNQLDTPVKQVFIEMLILQTNVNNSLTFGTELGIRDQAPNFAGAAGLQQTGSTTPSIFNTFSVNTPPNAGGLVSNTGFSISVIGQILTHGGVGFNSIGALISAINEDTDTDIILNPKIIAEDGSPAEVFVGTETRFKGQSVSNDQGSVITTNYEYRDVGSRLKVTPYIGNNGLITLDIDQELSAAIGTNNGGGGGNNQPITSNTVLDVGPVTSKATTTTRVHVPNNYFVILSGLMTDQYTYTIFRVPCLGGLPLVGGLFGTTTKAIVKQNLMIFIRPQIAETPVEIEELTRRNQDIWQDKNLRPDMFKYEVDTTLEFLNLKDPEHE